MALMLTLYNVILINLLVLISLVGNALLLDWDLFSLILFFVIFFISISTGSINIRTTYTNSVLTVFLSLVLVLIFYKSFYLKIPYFEYYFLWPIKTLLLVFLLYLISSKRAEGFTKVSGSNSFFMFISMTVFSFLLLVLFLGHKVDGRLSFVFGPNMLYRFVAVLFFLFFISFLVVKKRLFMKVPVFMILTAIVIFVLYEIGSRGGVIVVGLILALLLTIKLGRGRMLLLGGLTFVGCFLFNCGDVGSLGRIAEFKNLEDSARGIFIKEFLTHIVFSLNVWGEDWNYFYPYVLTGFMYPHNLFIELVLFYGILGWIMLFTILLSLYRGVRILKVGIHQRVLSLDSVYVLVFLTLLISSMFSGDLSDNFGVLAFAIYGVRQWRLS